MAGELYYFTLPVARVRELGGEAQDVRKSASGWWSACRDDQCVPFTIGKMRPEFA